MNRIFQILLILCVVLTNISFNAHAEIDKGTWKIHTVFNENKKRVIDTGDKVYCLTDLYINAYNKEINSWEGITKLNRLSDFHVNNIYYNAQKKYLVVTYNNFNIDILLENGTTVNIPNLKNMTTTSDKTINDVTFGSNSIYVASKVGYLVIDDREFNVTKSALFDSNVASIAEVGDYVLVANGSNVLYTAKSTNLKSVNQLTSTGLGASGNILPISKNQFFLQSNYLYLVTINGTTFTKTAVSKGKPVDVQVSANGFIAYDNSYFYEFESNGSKKTEVALPAELKSALITSSEADGSVWRLGNKGLKKVESSGTALTEELVPNAVTALRIGEIEYNKYNNRLYVTNGGPGTIYLINEYYKTGRISSFDGKTWKDEIPADMKGNKIQDVCTPVFDPEDSVSFYVGSWFQGVYKFMDGELMAKYDWENSPHIKAINWFCNIAAICFDQDGNMWTGQYSANERENDICVLPKENKNKENLTADDWVIPGYKQNLSRGMIIYITKNNYKFVFDGNYQAPLNIFETDDNFQVVKSKKFANFVDKEGKKVSWIQFYDFKEDLNGVLWVAHSNGIFSINPDEVFNEDFKVTRPRSSKNEFILDNTFSTSISVDDYNRKWVGTLDGGFYLLNEDCTEVIKHFTTANSCLPNNKVFSISWNSNTQSVFVGFNGGLVEYKPEEYTPKESIKIEPSVIKPSFEGHIKITNLPYNSIVTVKNSKGKVVNTLYTHGTTCHWDCMDKDNRKLETGSYTLEVTDEGTDHKEILHVYVIK